MKKYLIETKNVSSFGSTNWNPKNNIIPVSEEDYLEQKRKDGWRLISVVQYYAVYKYYFESLVFEGKMI